MKIVCLLGSPHRNGNSEAVARRFCAAAEAGGAEVQSFRLADLNYSGCRRAWFCKSSLDHCGLEDDLTPVLAAVQDADVLVMATPVYFTDVAWPLKACIDRFFSFLLPDYATSPEKTRLAPGKQLVLIQVQGEPEEHCADILPRYERSFRILGFDAFHLIRGCGLREPGAAEAHPDLMALAEETARRLFP